MKNKILLYIPLVMLFTLACGIATESDNSPDAQMPTEMSVNVSQATAEVSQTVEMVVVADKGLNIRANHTEISADIGDLFPGDVVECELPFTVNGDSIWCKHSLGWSNARYLKGK